MSLSEGSRDSYCGGILCVLLTTLNVGVLGTTVSNTSLSPSPHPPWFFQTARPSFTKILFDLGLLLAAAIIMVLFGLRITGLVPFWSFGIVVALLPLTFMALWALNDDEATDRAGARDTDTAGARDTDTAGARDTDTAGARDTIPSFIDERFYTLGIKKITLVSLGIAVFFIAGALLIYQFLHWTATSLPLVIQILVFGFGAFMAVVLGLTLLSPSGKDFVFYMWIRQFGRLGPIAELAVLFVVMTAYFGAGTYFLLRHGIVSFAGFDTHHVPSVDVITQFYTWHLLDIVPVLHIPATLRWPEPLIYSQPFVGFLVISFQLFFAIPAITIFFLYWKDDEAEIKLT